MRTVASIVAVVVVLAIALFLFRTQLTKAPAAPPQQQIDTAGVINDLVALGEAERLYLANHGSYATLDELQQEGSVAFSPSHRHGYRYTAQVDDGQHFRITAAPDDPSAAGGPTFSIDDTMQVKTP